MGHDFNISQTVKWPEGIEVSEYCYLDLFSELLANY
jgi:hypothetical protein